MIRYDTTQKKKKKKKKKKKQQQQTISKTKLQLAVHENQNGLWKTQLAYVSINHYQKIPEPWKTLAKKMPLFFPQMY